MKCPFVMSPPPLCQYHCFSSAAAQELYHRMCFWSVYLLIVVVFRAPVLTINPQRRRHGAHGRVLVDVRHAQPARRPAGFCRRHGIRVWTRVREA